VYIFPNRLYQPLQATRGSELLDTADVVEKCSGLSQPNDIRQALHLLREMVSVNQQ
jgi:hypothetical protein